MYVIRYFSFLGNLLAGEGIVTVGSGNKKENGIAPYNSPSSFSKFWNTKILSKWTKT